tara:strand:- start:476 stop:718 length:243 start_codon:yes stop_codon:yes gene_type:complete
MIVIDTKTFHELDVVFKYIEVLYDADAYEILLSKSYGDVGIGSDVIFEINDGNEWRKIDRRKGKEKKIASLLFEKYGGFL